MFCIADIDADGRTTVNDLDNTRYYVKKVMENIEDYKNLGELEKGKEKSR